MVKALEKKSEPTIDRAVIMDPENWKEVTNVTDPAMMRHMKALTMDRSVVSEKDPPGGVFSLRPLRYSCFLVSNARRVLSA